MAGKRHMKTVAEVGKLGEVLSFIDGVLDENNCPAKAKIQIDISAEEIFVNIANYAYKSGTGDAEITADVGTDYAKITFTDSGEKYDPLKKPDPDVTLAAEDRDIGGLGVYMVKKQMDEVYYEYKDGKNSLTIVKRF